MNFLYKNFKLNLIDFGWKNYKIVGFIECRKFVIFITIKNSELLNIKMFFEQ